MSIANRLVRPAIKKMSAYQSAAVEGGGRRGIKLDANENPFTPIERNSGGVNRYPAQQSAVLISRLSNLYGVTPAQLLATRGADEAIDLLIRTFCEPKKNSILICPPTFGYYEVAASIQDVKTNALPLKDDFSLASEELIKEANQTKPKLVFLCSPMNPTGNSLSLDVIREVANTLTDSLLVIDEAYIEFSDISSASGLIETYPNIVVLRTLSKAYGLAGARCGALLACEETISLVRKVLPPFPIPQPVEKIVLETLSAVNMPEISRRIEDIKEQKTFLEKKLQASSFIEKVFPSDANFLLVQVNCKEQFESVMARTDISVRARPTAIERGYRISVGTQLENQILLNALGVSSEQKINRVASTKRTTKETEILCSVDLDDSRKGKINTGLEFFDHMIEQIAKHAGIFINLECNGDLEIDAHHTIEDVMLTLGVALKEALGDKAGIGRYGFQLPMDETEASISLDIGGRPYCVFEGAFQSPLLGAYPTEMTCHAFRSLSEALGAAIHIKVTGENDHHKVEACFKAFGRALRMAIKQDGTDLPSTKGMI